MHAHHTIVDLATTPQPLPGGADGMPAALGRPGFVNAAKSLRVSVFAGHQFLAIVPHAGFIPLDGFHETL